MHAGLPSPELHIGRASAGDQDIPEKKSANAMSAAWPT
jgi:hypothetical protein